MQTRIFAEQKNQQNSLMTVTALIMHLGPSCQFFLSEGSIHLMLLSLRKEKLTEMGLDVFLKHLWSSTQATCRLV